MADIKISELPVATGPIQDDDILVLVRGGVTYRIDGDEHGTAGVDSFNGRSGIVVLQESDISGALNGFPILQNGTANIVYCTDAGGVQIVGIYSRSATPNAFAQRTSVGTLQAQTVADNHSQATPNDLTNRAYVNDLRTDRISSVNTSVASTTIQPDRDGIIVFGTPVTSFNIILPSALTKYKRVLIKFTTDVTGLTIDPGTNASLVANTMDYTPTSANAGDLFEWGYDVSTSTWLITNYVSFNSLP